MKRQQTSRAGRAQGSNVRDVAGSWANIRSARLAMLLAILCLIVAAVWYYTGDRAPAVGTNESLEAEPVGPDERFVNSAAQQPLIDPADALHLSPTLPSTAEQLADEAITACERLVEAFPERPQAHALLAVTLGKVGRKRDARKCWEDVIQLDARFAEAWLSVGKILSESGQYERAEEFLREAIKLDASIASAYHELTNVLLQLNKGDEALKFAQEGVRRFPENCHSHYWLGLAHSHRKEYQDACDHLKKAVEIEPNWSFPYYPLAMAYMHLGLTEQAAEYRRQTAKIKNESSQADRAHVRQYDDEARHRYIAGQTHLLAAALALQFEAPDLAEAYILRAAAVSPDDPASLDSLVYFFESRGRLADGVRALDELARNQPKQLSILLQQARWLASLSRWTQMKETLNRVVALDSECAEAHFLLAQACLRTHSDLAIAESSARKAVALDPTPGNLVLLAEVCRARGDYLGATRAMERYTSLNSRHK